MVCSSAGSGAERGGVRYEIPREWWGGFGAGTPFGVPIGSAGGGAGEDEQGDDPGGGQHQAERGYVTAHGGVSGGDEPCRRGGAAGWQGEINAHTLPAPVAARHAHGRRPGPGKWGRDGVRKRSPGQSLNGDAGSGVSGTDGWPGYDWGDRYLA
ncbi:hypothetical protein JCM9533A_11570 [Catenuloplanes niger JCM 9533]